MRVCTELQYTLILAEILAAWCSSFSKILTVILTIDINTEIIKNSVDIASLTFRWSPRRLVYYCLYFCTRTFELEYSFRRNDQCRLLDQILPTILEKPLEQAHEKGALNLNGQI